MNTDSAPEDICKECGKKYMRVIGYDSGILNSQPVVMYVCLECNLQPMFLDEDASDE